MKRNIIIGTLFVLLTYFLGFENGRWSMARDIRINGVSFIISGKMYKITTDEMRECLKSKI